MENATKQDSHRSERAEKQPSLAETHHIEEEILLAVRSVRYGSVEVVIQDSRVVQIERKEKVRFDRDRQREGR